LTVLFVRHVLSQALFLILSAQRCLTNSISRLLASGSANKKRCVFMLVSWLVCCRPYTRSARMSCGSPSNRTPRTRTPWRRRLAGNHDNTVSHTRGISYWPLALCSWYFTSIRTCTWLLVCLRNNLHVTMVFCGKNQQVGVPMCRI